MFLHVTPTPYLQVPGPIAFSLHTAKVPLSPHAYSQSLSERVSPSEQKWKAYVLRHPTMRHAWLGTAAPAATKFRVEKYLFEFCIFSDQFFNLLQKGHQISFWSASSYKIVNFNLEFKGWGMEFPLPLISLGQKSLLQNLSHRTPFSTEAPILQVPPGRDSRAETADAGRKSCPDKLSLSRVQIL